MTWGWVHNFPSSVDVFTKPIGYPAVGYDKILVDWFQDIFDAIEAIEISLRVPKTGQTISYRDGDDGFYEKGGDLLQDNEDGTVTDLETGLMWPKDGTGAGYNNQGDLSWNDAIDWAEALDFAGHTDWRLPNINELLSFQRKTWGHYQGQKSSYYWSSTTNSDDDTRALIVTFYYGVISANDKINTSFVVACRDS